MALTTAYRHQLVSATPQDGRVRLAISGRHGFVWVTLQNQEVESLIADLRSAQTEAKRRLFRRFRLHDDAQQVTEAR